MPDAVIACINCGEEFVWNEEEQEFYQSLNYVKPKRCTRCRPDRAAQRMTTGKENRLPVRKDYIDQRSIIRFVQAVEAHKGFRPEIRLVFSHLVEEVGELSRKIWLHEKGRTGSDTMDGYLAAREIGKELLDIIFLACYLAEILNLQLNGIIPERMREITEQYGIRQEDFNPTPTR